MREVFASLLLAAVGLGPAFLVAWFDPKSRRRRDRAKRYRTEENARDRARKEIDLSKPPVDLWHRPPPDTSSSRQKQDDDVSI